MVFQGRHGVGEQERAQPQPFEVDVELFLDLRKAGTSDDLERTVDYGQVFEIARSVIEGPSRRLLETLGESIADRVLAIGKARGTREVVVRVRKTRVPLPGTIDYAAVEISRKKGKS
jgi:dihydroneopterin aldolase